MATTITCDKCGVSIRQAIKVEFDDGEHPHCGSRMTKMVDLCVNCAIGPGVKLTSYCEWDDFKNSNQEKDK